MLFTLKKIDLGKIKKYLMDNTAKKHLSWKNKISLDKGLDKVIAWQILNKKKLVNSKTYYKHKP